RSGSITPGTATRRARSRCWPRGWPSSRCRRRRSPSRPWRGDRGSPPARAPGARGPPGRPPPGGPGPGGAPGAPPDGETESEGLSGYQEGAVELGLQGRVALVTGGSKGIGRACAVGLAAEGARLALCARGAEGLARVAEDLGAKGAEVLTVAA